MVRKGAVIGLVVLAVAAGGMFALFSSPVGAQRGPDDGVAVAVSSRYRVTVLRVAVPAEATGEALNLADFAREIPGALVAKSDAPGLRGHFGAVPSQKDLLHMLSKRGTSMEVIFTGETETVPGKKGSVNSGQRFPLATMEMRGNQTIVTTKFEQTGIKVEVLRSPHPGPRGDVHEMTVELSATTAHVGGMNPVIFEVASKGSFMLPDGYTAVLSYLDRVEGFVLMNTVQSLAAGTPAPQEMPADIVAQYFMLVTRMDLK